MNLDDLSHALIKEDLVVGTGATAEAGQELLVHYVGRLADGTQFDSSRARQDPLDFALGAGHMIKGWEQGLPGMKVGGTRRLTIPPELAYGDSGLAGVIPPNATLVFEVELLKIEQPSASRSVLLVCRIEMLEASNRAVLGVIAR